ncbi:Fic family protein [Tissierella carlieri]|uniref:Fic family protein n=1 Tax=Tissierella carlieri TaxID=689904 RepID=UPI001C100E16|nr:Fic family protein [Tissierella carlieri]MBU5310876.1 Fic family protein [Tissierella carlieri]
MKKPFEPNFLPISLDNSDTIEILKLEGEARAKVEKFNSILERSVIKKELLMLFSMNESVQSTKIEGTQASFSEVIESEVTGNTNKDITEVLNYFDALTKAQDLLKQIPISTRMFYKLHETILKDSRGQSRSPGSYRKVQNFIGPTDRKEDATYIPPEATLVEKYMSNLEKYINDEYEDDFGYISRAAIIHGQFETIHPFLDGNGRLGRILIIIYLLDKGIISYPSFFVSEELEKSKYKYYALLNGLRLEKPRWKEWIIFFLNSAIKQADKYIEKLLSIESLYIEMMSIAKEKSISDDAVLFIFNKPIFTIKKMQEVIGVSYNTARRYVTDLAESGKIYGDDKQRNRVYSFYDLIDIL